MCRLVIIIWVPKKRTPHNSPRAGRCRRTRQFPSTRKGRDRADKFGVGDTHSGPPQIAQTTADTVPSCTVPYCTKQKGPGIKSRKSSRASSGGRSAIPGSWSQLIWLSSIGAEGPLRMQSLYPRVSEVCVVLYGGQSTVVVQYCTVLYCTVGYSTVRVWRTWAANAVQSRSRLISCSSSRQVSNKCWWEREKAGKKSHPPPRLCYVFPLGLVILRSSVKMHANARLLPSMFPMLRGSAVLCYASLP